MWCLAGLLLLFPVSGHALAGIVVCFESNGRIEFENSRTGDCASNVFAIAEEVHSEFAATVTEVVAGDDCPTSCIDVLLFASPADGQAASARNIAANDIAPVAVAATTYAAPLTHDFKYAHRGDDRASLISPINQLGTIVLLI